MLNTAMHHDANTSLYHLVDQIIKLAINGIILYYLYRPSVKEYLKNFYGPVKKAYFLKHF